MTFTTVFVPRFLILGILLLFLSAAQVRAEILTVTKIADTNDAACDADCSLREAIGAAASGDVIQFATPPFNAPQTIVLSLGELTINKSLTIMGSGADLLTVANSSGGSTPAQTRIFSISGSAVTVKLSGMAIFGGYLPFDAALGAGVLNSDATVFLTNAHIYGNSAGIGGGVFNLGTMHILNTTVAANFARYTLEGGGGIYNAGAMTVTNSTISGNTGEIASNIINSGNLTLTNATLGAGASNNRSVLNKRDSTMLIRNTIVAGNLANSSNTAFTSQGNNLIQDSSQSAGWIATDLLNVNPQLGALSLNNGGQIPTQMPAPTSPAINAGNNSLAINPFTNQFLNLDARLYNRIVGGKVDIGAVEANSSLPGAVSIVGKINANANGRGVFGALAILRFVRTGEIRYAVTNPFGYVNFNNIPMGATVIISLTHKRYKISPLIFTAVGEADYFYFNSDPKSVEAVSNIVFR